MIETIAVKDFTVSATKMRSKCKTLQYLPIQSGQRECLDATTYGRET